MAEDPQPGRRRDSIRAPASALRNQAVEAARRSKQRLLMLTPLVAAFVLAYLYRQQLFGVDAPVKIGVAAVLVVLGWAVALNLGRVVQPRLDRRFAPGTSGVAGFLLRLTAVAVATLVSLRLAGLNPKTLAAGAGFTAIVLGLAAQQTFGNIFAGVVLLSARPFRVGDRVRFNGFGMDVEGTVADLGLLYVTMRDGEDTVMVPNNTALTMSARPIREPAALDMKARLPRGVDPEAVQRKVSEAVTVATLGPPHVSLEEFDGHEVTFEIRATPVDRSEGSRLAREVLDAVSSFADGTQPRRAA
jgi:small-conductance mechanosensitive channel